MLEGVIRIRGRLVRLLKSGRRGRGYVGGARASGLSVIRWVLKVWVGIVSLVPIATTVAP